MIFQAGGLTGHSAILWQYAVVAPRPNMGASAEPERGGINQVSRQDRIGFVETLYRAVADASGSDNKSRLAPQRHQDV